MVNMDPKFLKPILPAILPRITFIFNTMITQSSFPRNWKYANSEYRPIAILLYSSKDFERLLHSYVEDNNLIIHKQFSFVKNVAA